MILTGIYWRIIIFSEENYSDLDFILRNMGYYKILVVFRLKLTSLFSYVVQYPRM